MIITPKKLFSIFEETADNVGLSQTILDMKRDYHIIFFKNYMIKINDEKTSLVKLYYYNPFAEYDEGR